MLDVLFMIYSLHCLIFAGLSLFFVYSGIWRQSIIERHYEEYGEEPGETAINLETLKVFVITTFAGLALLIWGIVNPPQQ